MTLKDYYKILGIPPHASRHEIKQAYRKLVMRYHPDKTENKEALSKFREIREAYETLINPVKKDAYLQERWYYQSIGKKYASGEALSPLLILNEGIDLNKYISSQNSFRVNKEKINHSLEELLSAENIEMLNSSDEKDINDQLIKLMLDTAPLLDFEQLQILEEKLPQISTHEDHLFQKLRKLKRNKANTVLLERYTPLFIFIITVLICLLIFLLSK